jgi:hypothetical protein
MTRIARFSLPSRHREVPVKLIIRQSAKWPVALLIPEIAYWLPILHTCAFCVKKTAPKGRMSVAGLPSRHREVPVKLIIRQSAKWKNHFMLERSQNLLRNVCILREKNSPEGPNECGRVSQKILWSLQHKMIFWPTTRWIC